MILEESWYSIVEPEVILHVKECKEEEFYPGTWLENPVEPCEKIA